MKGSSASSLVLRSIKMNRTLVKIWSDVKFVLQKEESLQEMGTQIRWV